MTDVNAAFDDAQKTARDIEGAENSRDALVHAFNGISNLLLSILSELREMNERQEDTNK